MNFFDSNYVKANTHGNGSSPPPGAIFSGFTIGRNSLPFIAMAVLAEGTLRVGA